MVEVEADRADTVTFLAALLGEVPEDKYALFWTLQNKRSTWAPLSNGVEAAANSVLSLADEGMDVYVAVSVADEPGRHDTRIMSANSAGLMGLWADIDIADPDVHKKWNLPPDEKAAMELLNDCGATPTLIVHSGHGLQAWWLFPEFWAFESEEERLSAATLAQQWNTTLRVRAAEKGWTVDSTFDLARVMRVPGTLNRKGSPVVPVQLLSAAGPRWNQSDFERYLCDESMFTSRSLNPDRKIEMGTLDLSDKTNVPFDKFNTLMENTERFEDTWKRQRRDFSDQSASSYDLSLASQALAAHWTWQEVRDLCMDWRKKHREDPSKWQRQDYVERTLRKAAQAVAVEDADERLDDAIEALQQARDEEDPDAERERRRGLLGVLGEMLGSEKGEFPLVHVIQYGSEPASYAFVTPKKTIQLGGIETLYNPHKLRMVVMEATRYLIPLPKKGKWDKVLDALAEAWEIQDVGYEATASGEVHSWLSQYLASRPPVASLEEAAAPEYPYIDEQGQTVMFGPAFRRWIYLQHQEKLSNAKLGQRLRAFGCRPDKVNVNIDGSRTSRSVWILPTEHLK